MGLVLNICESNFEREKNMKNILKKILLTGTSFLMVAWALPTLAMQGIPGMPGAPDGPGISDQQLGLQYGAATGLSSRDPRLTVAMIIRSVIAFLGIITVCIMVYAGFLWMTSAGNDEKIGQAKGWMFGATIGLAIILSAYGLASLVVNSLLGATGYGVIPFF